MCEDVAARKRLIAAAPDLLYALKAMVASCQEHHCGLRIADEAIAKAEGAPPVSEVPVDTGQASRAR